MASDGAPIYRLLVTLRFVEPLVWRRFLASRDIGLADLHRVLQIVMGWPDRHFHLFSTEASSYGTPDVDMPFVVLPEGRFRLRQIAPNVGDRFLYEYDFGDGWAHDLVVEEIVPADPEQALPLCLDGARACPPDGVGAMGGYARFLEAIANTSDPRHTSLVTWVGGSFDPEFFDVQTVNRQLGQMARACARMISSQAKEQ